MNQRPKTVLFLCTGNYYRSRFAELFFNARARERGLDCRAESAGLAQQCWTRNRGALSPAVLDAMAARGQVLPSVPRMPQDVTAAQVRAALRVVGLCEHEHRGPFETRFGDFTDRIIYWDVEDVGRTAPSVALDQIAARVEALLDQLAAAAKQRAPVQSENA